jgi:hypothetical protein
MTAETVLVDSCSVKIDMDAHRKGEIDLYVFERVKFLRWSREIFGGPTLARPFVTQLSSLVYSSHTIVTCTKRRRRNHARRAPQDLRQISNAFFLLYTSTSAFSTSIFYKTLITRLSRFRGNAGQPRTCQT